jgi:hypothetical protein
MGKVPVGRTISQAYRFLFLRPGAVLGLGWLPAAFYAGAAWFCLERLGHAMQVAVPSSAAFNEFTAVDFLALLLATALLVPTAAVAYADRALGRHSEHVAAHFVYGKREFRLSLALLGFYVLIIAVLAALAFLAQFAIGIGMPKPGEAGSGFAMPLEWYGVPLALWLNGAAAFLLAIVALFVSARAGFYLTVLATAEDHVNLGRAWALSRGSFWRLAVVHVVLAVPLALLVAGAVYLIEGDAIADVLRTGWTGIPSEGMSALYKLQYEHAGALAGILAVGMIVTSALFAGASSAAYRAVVLGEEAEAPVSAPAYVPMPAPSMVAVHAAAPARIEPDHEPAWAAAKAMADAGTPQWRHDPFAQPLPDAPEPVAVPDEHALASEAAATTYAAQEEAPLELVAEPEQVAEPVAEPVAHQAEAPAHEPPSKQELIMAQIVHAAFAQMPGYVGEELPTDVHAAGPGHEAAAHADLPLDPGGAGTVLAAREDAKEPAE